MPRRSRSGATRSPTPSTTGPRTRTIWPSSLDPARRGDAYVAVDDADGALVGYFSFKQAALGTITVGLGLRPDHTGRGLGRAFLAAGLDYARTRFRPKHFALSVATFNRRAITVYERAGFVPERVYEHATNGGVWEFVEMRRPA